MNSEFIHVLKQIFPDSYEQHTDEKIIAHFETAGPYKVYTYKVDGKIVACATLHEDPYYSPHLLLKCFGTLPDHQRKGYAKMLFNSIKTHEKKPFKIECDANDELAVKFYDSLKTCKRYDIVYVSE
jgi:GNAT superfamily N-acetyltransferase